MNGLFMNIPLLEYKIYEFRRGPDGYEGALIIYAQSVDDALKIYQEHELTFKKPYAILELPFVRGVLHDNDMR